MTLGRATYEPGWKWSLHAGAKNGTGLCEIEHVGMVIAGTATAAFEDGAIVELRSGRSVLHTPNAAR